MTSEETGHGSSALTIGELVETSHLGLSYVAGAEGAHRRAVWAHVSDLENPAAWLDGGELLITNGLSFPVDAASQVRYLVDLDGRRAAGLAIGVRNPPLHPELLAEADRRRFPLLRVAKETPYQSIARLVAAAAHGDATRRLQTHVRIFDALLPRAIGEYGPADLFRRLERLTGYRLYFVTGEGHPVLEGFEPLPDHVAGLLRELGDRSPGIPGGFAIRLPLRPGADGYVVALEQQGGDPVGLGAVRYVSTIAALELAEAKRARAERRRRGAEILSELLSGRLDAASAELRMVDCGFAMSMPLVVAALRSGTPDIVDEVHHRLSDRGVPHMLLTQDTAVLVVVPTDPDVLAAAVGDLDLRGGVSLPRVGLADWASARREAMWALNHGRSSSAIPLAHYDLDDTAVAWMPTEPQTLAELVNRNLGPLFAYDRERNSEMLKTLRVFFDQGRRLSSAAEELFIHKHTLSYRLRRIQELTGRDFSRMTDLTELWLSLKALDTLEFRDGAETDL